MLFSAKLKLSSDLDVSSLDGDGHFRGTNETDVPIGEEVDSLRPREKPEAFWIDPGDTDRRLEDDETGERDIDWKSGGGDRDRL